MTSMILKFPKTGFRSKLKKYPVSPFIDYQLGIHFFLESYLKIQQDDFHWENITDSYLQNLIVCGHVCTVHNKLIG